MTITVSITKPTYEFAATIPFTLSDGRTGRITLVGLRVKLKLTTPTFLSLCTLHAFVGKGGGTCVSGSIDFATGEYDVPPGGIAQICAAGKSSLELKSGKGRFDPTKL